MSSFDFSLPLAFFSPTDEISYRVTKVRDQTQGHLWQLTPASVALHSLCLEISFEKWTIQLSEVSLCEHLVRCDSRYTSGRDSIKVVWGLDGRRCGVTAWPAAFQITRGDMLLPCWPIPHTWIQPVISGTSCVAACTWQRLHTSWLMPCSRSGSGSLGRPSVVSSGARPDTVGRCQQITLLSAPSFIPGELGCLAVELQIWFFLFIFETILRLLPQNSKLKVEVFSLFFSAYWAIFNVDPK